MRSRRCASLEADGLIKTYKSRNGTAEAVKGVDLAVRRLTTLLTITDGTARVAGDPDGARRRIGVAL